MLASDQARLRIGEVSKMLGSTFELLGRCALLDDALDLGEARQLTCASARHAPTRQALSANGVLRALSLAFHPAPFHGRPCLSQASCLRTELRSFSSSRIVVS